MTGVNPPLPPWLAGPASRTELPRFVILEHDHPQTHWDFMLEGSESLRTWRLEEPPALGREVHAEASFDHRKIYLEYEGPVSGGRGTVSRWDFGRFAWDEEGPDRVVVSLFGRRSVGRVVLCRRGSNDWSLTLEEEPSEPGDDRLVSRSPSPS